MRLARRLVMRPRTSSVSHPATLLVVMVLFVGFATVGCGDGTSMRANPFGPGPGAGEMHTMGASMAVASEFDYLTRMIPHHEEAIATARILQRGTERQDMRAFAAAIIETQSTEVDQMKSWLAAWD